MTLPTNQDPVAPGTTGSVTTPASAPGTNTVDYEALYKQALAEVQDYKNRWTGLQGKYNQEQQKWQGDASKLTGLETQLQEALGQKTTYETQFKTLQETSNSTVQELTSLKTKHDRLNTIMTEFPTLIPFLAVQQGERKVDLLPQGTGDELRALLAAFQTSIQSLPGSHTQTTTPPPPASPPPPPAATVPTTSDLQKRVFEAAAKGDMETYNRLYEEWIKEQQKK